MGFSGNPGEVKSYAKRLAHLAANSKYVAKGAAPKVEALMKRTIAAGTDPYGEAWTPSKSGGKPLAGAGGSGDITVRVERSGRAIKTVVGGILRFHHDGTKTGGRKAQKKARDAVRAGQGKYKGTRALTKKEWKRAGNDEEDYADYRAAVKEGNKYGRAEHSDRRKAAQAAAAREVRAAGKVWDPERPLIPEEGRGIPAPWKAAVLEAAHDLLDKVGAQQTGGA